MILLVMEVNNIQNQIIIIYSLGLLNDLWKYDGNNWTWISGSNIPNQLGNYGQQGISSSSNIPSPRYGSVSWIDNNYHFWLFGGQNTLGNLE